MPDAHRWYWFVRFHWEMQASETNFGQNSSVILLSEATIPWLTRSLTRARYCLLAKCNKECGEDVTALRQYYYNFTALLTLWEGQQLPPARKEAELWTDWSLSGYKIERITPLLGKFAGAIMCTWISPFKVSQNISLIVLFSNVGVTVVPWTSY